MKEFLGRLGLLLFGVGLSLLMLELLLRLAAPQIYPLHPVGLYVDDPDVGYVLAPGFEGQLQRSEFTTIVTSNEAGLRGPALRPRGDNTVRILLLGDSQTWGFGVEDDETYAAVLEALLQASHPELDVQVLNGGVPGYGTIDQLHFLQSRGAALAPDIVMVQFLSVNDLKENQVPADEWAVVRDGMLSSRSPELPVEPPAWDRFQQWIKQNSHAAVLLFDQAGYWGTRLGLLDQVDLLWGEDFSPAQAELGRELLVTTAAETAALDADMLFLYTTGQVHVLADTYTEPATAAVVAAAAEEAGVPWLDVAAAMQGHPDRLSLYFRQNGHWTARGHEVLAELLAAEIQRLGLLERGE